MIPDDPSVERYICPECFEGKHRNCDGSALDFVHDAIVVCDCYQHQHQD